MRPIIISNPDIMHGEPCFAGTRVTAKTFFDHFEAGYNLDEFLADFPTVQRSQVQDLFTELQNANGSRSKQPKMGRRLAQMKKEILPPMGRR